MVGRVDRSSKESASFSVLKLRVNPENHYMPKLIAKNLSLEEFEMRKKSKLDSEFEKEFNEVELVGVNSAKSTSKSESVSDLRTIFIEDTEATRQSLSRESGGRATMDNTVVTSLYTWYDFIPKNTWKQLQRRQVSYYVLIAIMQVSH